MALPSSPSQNLIYTIYVSSAVCVPTNDELLELVQTSAARNARRGITGVLLHKDGSFMQVLEGPEREVLELVGTIERDPRHKGLLKLLTRSTAERQFADWSMGFRDLNTLSNEDRAAFEPYLSGLLSEHTTLDESSAAYKLLHNFRQSSR